jgi:hypothetical protein
MRPLKALSGPGRPYKAVSSNMILLYDNHVGYSNVRGQGPPYKSLKGQWLYEDLRGLIRPLKGLTRPLGAKDPSGPMKLLRANGFMRTLRASGP